MRIYIVFFINNEVIDVQLKIMKIAIIFKNYKHLMP